MASAEHGPLFTGDEVERIVEEAMEIVGTSWSPEDTARVPGEAIERVEANEGLTFPADEPLFVLLASSMPPPTLSGAPVPVAWVETVRKWQAANPDRVKMPGLATGAPYTTSDGSDDPVRASAEKTVSDTPRVIDLGAPDGGLTEKRSIHGLSASGAQSRGGQLRMISMSELRITDEMVDAGAAAAFFQDDLGGHIAGRWTWETIPEEGRANYRMMVRAAVEAALQAGGFTEERRFNESRVVGGWRAVPWREVVSDGE